MTIFGTIIAIILAIVFGLLLGPFGGIVLFAIIFGMVLSMHLRNKEMYEDLQLIKEKLGIDRKDDYRLEEYIIEKELSHSQQAGPAERTAIDEEIEKELEEYLEQNDKDDTRK